MLLVSDCYFQGVEKKSFNDEDKFYIGLLQGTEQVRLPIKADTYTECLNIKPFSPVTVKVDYRSYQNRNYLSFVGISYGK